MEVNMNLLLKPFVEMTDEDYADLGLKAGLEIHQQLKTEKKLFCHCPAGKYNKEYDAEILRHMRPTLSELGEYDGTALMEFKTKKEIIYQINHESVCTYEMDDTPPFQINQQALDISLEIAMLMNYKLVSEIHIARKQYLDGSIPTGFQRTTIVGIDGWIPYKNRKIGLIQLGLEEDSCREISDIAHTRTYVTDRLGMPLIETVTKPDMKTPQEVADVANILRWLVRSTGKVNTGIGAARQDVNVSIKGGTRVEIKGVHRIPYIPKLIYNEVLRQYSLLKIKDELKSRGITEKTFQASSENVTHYLQNTSWEPISRAIKRGEEIHCVNLKGYSGILSYPTQTGRVFSREISDRVRVISCLTRSPNILTSESTEESIESIAGNRIRKALNATSRDALILVWGNKKDLTSAVDEIKIRAKEATIGIPSETRQAMIDGTNGFERILPGPDRMYPDTDLPPLEISVNRINSLKKNVPEQLWKREKKYRKIGVPEHLIIKIASSPKAELFEYVTGKLKITPILAARIMFEKTTDWKRSGLNTENITAQNWKEYFKYVLKYPALAEVADRIFWNLLVNEISQVKHEIGPFIISTINENDIKFMIGEAIKENINWDISENLIHKQIMGIVMKQLRGIVNGKIVSNKTWSEMKRQEA
jgi:glutamyl-tRNA(Gln) amidotransferase subunit E